MNIRLPGIALAALLSLTACFGHKEDTAPVATTGAKLDIALCVVTASPVTKTALVQETGGDRELHLHARWTADDRLGVFIDDWDEATRPELEMDNDSEVTGPASFSGVIKDILDGSHKLYAFCSKSHIGPKGGHKLDFEVPEQQNSGEGIYDQDADTVVNDPYYIVFKPDDSEATIRDMVFTRPLATVAVQVKNNTSTDLSAEKIHKITIESSADIALSGTVQWDYESGSLNILDGKKRVTANLAPPLAIDGVSNAYLLLPPVTLPEGSSLVVTLETEHYKIVKTASGIPAGYIFSGNRLSALLVNLNEADTYAYASSYSSFGQ